MLFKALSTYNHGPFTAYSFDEYLPRGKQPGKWTEKRYGLSICLMGWHGCKDGEILEYLTENIYEIETRGQVLEGDGKFTAQQIRFIRKCNWNIRTMRSFACDCLKRYIHICHNMKLNKLLREYIYNIEQQQNEEDDRIILERDLRFIRSKIEHEFWKDKTLHNNGIWELVRGVRVLMDNPKASISYAMDVVAAITPDDKVWLKEKKWQRKQLLKYLVN